MRKSLSRKQEKYLKLKMQTIASGRIDQQEAQHVSKGGFGLPRPQLNLRVIK
jgi:hypothetical protein